MADPRAPGTGVCAPAPTTTGATPSDTLTAPPTDASTDTPGVDGVGAPARSLRARVLWNAAVCVLVTITYYTAPMGDSRPTGVRVLATALLGCGLAATIVLQLRHHADRLARLVSVLIITVMASAATVYTVAHADPSQFEGLGTRTDALYFTVITMSTIGYGDIHPAGQGARLLVIAMVGFDAVFIGSLASTIASQVRARGLRHDENGGTR